MARRLGRHPYYHIQQILLADLIARSAPARVLELGCGFGRHQAYLADIPGVTLFGADQSAAMLAAAPRSVGAKRAPLRLVQNDPLAGLPFRDKAFDVTFTVNALLHVPPRDIAHVVAELVRVTRGRILHLEPALDVPVDRLAHDGCYNHDYPALYARHGARNLRVEPYCRIQEAVVVDLERHDAPPPWPAALLRVLRGMEAALEDGAFPAAAFPEREAALEEALRDARAAARDTRARLDQVLASRTWRWGIRLACTPLGRMADRLLRALGR